MTTRLRDIAINTSPVSEGASDSGKTDDPSTGERWPGDATRTFD
jgi:hypothetical protein